MSKYRSQSRAKCEKCRIGYSGLSFANKGFTLIEVMMAATVMAMGISVAIIGIQIGIRDLDIARTSTVVSQAMQNEIERLRLDDWTGISELPGSEVLDLNTTFYTTAGSGNSKIKVTRTVSDVPDHADMKEIVITAEWTSVDGRPHTRAYRMRYSKNGLYDYYYTSNVET